MGREDVKRWLDETDESLLAHELALKDMERRLVRAEGVASDLSARVKALEDAKVVGAFTS